MTNQLPVDKPYATQLGEKGVPSVRAALVLFLLPAGAAIVYFAFDALPLDSGNVTRAALRLYLALYVATLLHILAMAFFGIALVKAPIEEIKIGMGMGLLRFRFSGIPMRFALPFPGGYVRYSEAVEPCLYDRWPGVLTNLSGCFVLLLLATVSVGPWAFPGVFQFWYDYWAGAISPFGRAPQLLAQLAQLVMGTSGVRLLSLVFFGAAAFNLMPLPALNGGALWMWLLPQKSRERAFQIGFTVFIVSLIAWIVALVHYVIS